MNESIGHLLFSLHHYFQNFSASFKLALGLWPVIAAVVTIPIIVFEHVKFHQVRFWRVAMWYGFVLYLLGLLALTLYPLPDNPAQFCAEFNASTVTQKIPLENIAGALESKSNFVQVAMNVAFFIPLGVFLRYIFGFRWYSALLLAFGASLLLETAQLTGAFGYYPCRYRMFDVDDLISNTFGGMVGFAGAWLLTIGDRAQKSTS